jgi:hypothetical protein
LDIRPSSPAACYSKVVNGYSSKRRLRRRSHACTAITARKQRSTGPWESGSLPRRCCGAAAKPSGSPSFTRRVATTARRPHPGSVSCTPHDTCHSPPSVPTLPPPPPDPRDSPHSGICHVLPPPLPQPHPCQAGPKVLLGGREPVSRCTSSTQTGCRGTTGPVLRPEDESPEDKSEYGTDPIVKTQGKCGR